MVKIVLCFHVAPKFSFRLFQSLHRWYWSLGNLLILLSLARTVWDVMFPRRTMKVAGCASVSFFGLKRIFHIRQNRWWEIIWFSSKKNLLVFYPSLWNCSYAKLKKAKKLTDGMFDCLDCGFCLSICSWVVDRRFYLVNLSRLAPLFEVVAHKTVLVFRYSSFFSSKSYKDSWQTFIDS